MEEGSGWRRARRLALTRNRSAMRAAILPLSLATAAAKITAAEPYGLTPTEVSSLAKASRSSLTAPIRTIIDRPQESPAKDPHDYVSYARYYWPDPADRKSTRLNSSH